MNALASPHFVPDFDVAIDGRPLPAELRARIMAVRFEEALEGAGRVELTLANPGLVLLDASLLDLDRRLELSLGYRPAGPQRVFAGEITGVEPTFPATGMPTLVVSAQDATRHLNAGSKQRGFPFQLTDSAIATIVAAENRLVAIPDPAGAAMTALSLLNERPRFQHKQSDYAFLRGIAAEYGFEMWVEGDILNFRPLLPGLPAPEIELRWGASLLEFAPRVTSIGQVAAVRARVWIEALKTQLAVELAYDGERIRVSVRPAVCGVQSGTVDAVLDLPDIPFETPVEAIKVAVGELRRRLNSRVSAAGSAVGDPRFRVGRLIAVDGVGPSYSARTWRLTSVAHALGQAGYRTAFQARLEVV